MQIIRQAEPRNVLLVHGEKGKMFEFPFDNQKTIYFEGSTMFHHY